MTRRTASVSLSYDVAICIFCIEITQIGILPKKISLMNSSAEGFTLRSIGVSYRQH